MMRSTSSRCPSSGLTLVEVIFAIGVILIGLVGLTSILPLAGHRAQDSLDFDAGAAIGEAVLSELESRGLIHEPRVTTLPVAPDVIQTSPIVPVGGAAIRQPGNVVIHPFCFDPLFGAIPPATSTNSYTSVFFPFYKSSHNPLADPATLAATVGLALNSQPRLLRVRLNPIRVRGATPILFTNQQQLELARTLVESGDDLPQQRPRDRSKPSVVAGLQAVASGLPFGKTVPTGSYSWMVTVDPDVSSSTASVSVVIMRGRERFDDFPGITPATDVTKPRDNAVSERLALVVDRIGFRGGAGGTIQLMASAATLSNLTSNDWILLSRNTVSNQPQHQVHRWYRVVAAQGEAERIVNPTDVVFEGQGIPLSTLLPATMPPDPPAEVWSRTVRLDGSDWDFASPPTPGTVNWWTYATIVNDVVSVKTTTIPLADF